MIWTLQNPPPRPILILQMLKETLVKEVGRLVTGVVYPFAIGGYVVRRIKAQTCKYMSRNFRALLRSFSSHRMERGNFGCQSRKTRKLAVDNGLPSIRLLSRPRIDRLPAAHHVVRTIAAQEIMEETGTGAWQSGYEDRLFNRLAEDHRSLLFRKAQHEQIAQQTQRVPTGRKPPESAQIGLVLVAAQQHLERFLEAPLAEIGEPRPLLSQ